jgi:F-type H+-transporting ATPase subunit gamma
MQLHEIRARIKGIQNIQQITRAMKMVAVARLRRAQERLISARPYGELIKAMLQDISAMIEDRSPYPLLCPRDGGRALLVLMTSDRGLCGGFNVNIIRGALEFMEGKETSLIVIGKKGINFFAKRSFPVKNIYPGVFLAEPRFSYADMLGEELIRLYEGGECDEVWVLYNKFVSAMRQGPTLEKLIPIEPAPYIDREGRGYIYEPSPEGILSKLLPRYVKYRLMSMMLESFASEQGARMIAMDNATENAGALIESLTLEYNRARQESITREISEIVMSAEAI